MSRPLRAIVFDWETTGIPLHPKAKLSLQPRAIEFGAVVIEGDGSLIRELSYIIDPGILIEPIITKITGLTNDDLIGKPKFADVVKFISEGFAMADVMIAHNLPFDESILQFELERLGPVAKASFPWPRHGLCTVQTFQEDWGKRPKLTELYEKIMGVKLAQTHRASDDARALAELVVKAGLLRMFE